MLLWTYANTTIMVSIHIYHKKDWHPSVTDPSSGDNEISNLGENRACSPEVNPSFPPELSTSESYETWENSDDAAAV